MNLSNEVKDMYVKNSDTGKDSISFPVGSLAAM